MGCIIPKPPTQPSLVPARMEAGFHDHYVLGKQLGVGSFSVVKEGRNKESGEMVAVKCVAKSKLTTPEGKNALEREISVLRELQRNPHLFIQLYEVYDEKDCYFLVTEHMAGGELLHRIMSFSQYNEKVARDICVVLLDAVRHLHDYRFAHRDIKIENILLTVRGCVKIADFGLATRCLRPASLTTQCGSPRYVAPEILEGKPYDMQVDIWSLGVLFFFLIGGYPPFLEANQRDLFLRIRKGSYAFDTKFWGHTSDESRSLVSSMLALDPSARVTAGDALGCSWIKASDEALLSHGLDVNLEAFKTFNAGLRLKVWMTKSMDVKEKHSG